MCVCVCVCVVCVCVLCVCVVCVCTCQCVCVPVSVSASPYNSVMCVIICVLVCSLCTLVCQCVSPVSGCLQVQLQKMLDKECQIRSTTEQFTLHQDKRLMSVLLPCNKLSLIR